MKKLNGRPLASVMACNFVFIPPLVRPIRRPRSSFFYPKAGSRAVGLEIDRIDYEGLRFGPLGGQAFHHPSEHAHFAPPFPAVIQCFVRPIFPRCISPTQAVPVDEDDPAQHPFVINPWLAVDFGKYGERRAICSCPSARSLMLSLLAEPESYRCLPINGS